MEIGVSMKFRASFPARSLIGLILAALAFPARGDEGFPDFDLRIPCAPRISGIPSGKVRFPAQVILGTAPGGTDGRRGARAWSLSLAASIGVSVLSASTAETVGAPAPGGLRDDGYEKTEVLSGGGNVGVVSAVILSFSKDISLPGTGEAVLLDFVIEADVPATGCAVGRLDFVDGLRGSGQPVRNIITFGEDSASTRRDDGGSLDNDADGYEACVFATCAGPYFVRGDATGDLGVDLSDAIAVLVHLFGSGPSPNCLRAVDADDDGSISVSDAIYLMNHLYRGGAPPPAPYPDCGLVTKPSGLTCNAAQHCP